MKPLVNVSKNILQKLHVAVAFELSLKPLFALIVSFHAQKKKNDAHSSMDIILTSCTSINTAANFNEYSIF